MTAIDSPEETRSPHLRVWAIAGPAILANSSAPMVGFVDIWAIGHLPGAVHLAAVGLGSVIFSYIMWTFGFLRMGTTGLVAQAKGRNDSEELLATVIRSSALALFCGLLLLALQEPILALSLKAMAPPEGVAEITAQYFRIRIWAAPFTLLVFVISGVLFGLGRTRAVLWIQLLLNLTNGVLNVALVVGLDMGVPGVAWGTLIAQCLAALASIWVMINLFGWTTLLGAMRDARSWVLERFRQLVLINGFIFIRTIFLMTALAMVMRVAGGMGETAMAASHVINQFMLLLALGLDGFAHAAEALAGAAWGLGKRDVFRRWVVITSAWAVGASLVYSLFFWLGGNSIIAVLTDLEDVRALSRDLMPLLVIMPVVSVWCYQMDGVFIGATAAGAMMVTMGIAFGIYLLILDPMTSAWGLRGLWGAVLVFIAVRGISQLIWYPYLERRLG
ncbi:MAG: MATE family efflux transporter [Xanthomonadales bacterium]